MAFACGTELVILHTVFAFSFSCQGVFKLPARASATVRWVFSSTERKGSGG
jgi:hypothetical protein